jgi:hypothetical protein
VRREVPKKQKRLRRFAGERLFWHGFHGFHGCFIFPLRKDRRGKNHLARRRPGRKDEFTTEACLRQAGTKTESTEIIFFLLAGDAAERKPLGPSGIKNKG